MAGSWRDSLHWTRLSTTSLCSQFLRVWTWPCQQAPTVRLVSTSSWGEHVPLLLLAVLMNRVARCLFFLCSSARRTKGGTTSPFTPSN